MSFIRLYSTKASSSSFTIVDAVVFNKPIQSSFGNKKVLPSASNHSKFSGYSPKGIKEAITAK